MLYCKLILVALAVVALASSGAGQGRQALVNFRLVEGSRERVVPLTVALSDTVASVKSKIATQQRVAANRQQFLFNGQSLDDHDTLANAGVEQGSEVRVVVRAASV